MDPTDRLIINSLQGGFPITEWPYAEVAAQLGLNEAELLDRIERLLADRVLSRFGPMYNIERMGGAFSLCAMAVPPDEIDQVAEQVNRHPEVAHNYERDHRLNIWFVAATERPHQIPELLAEIERETGYRVYDMPKSEEFFVGLRFEA